MPQPVEVMFGEWLPSAPSFKNPGCEVARNCIPLAGGAYGPLRSLEGGDLSASGVVKGAELMFDNSGDAVIVGGTNDKLFVQTTSLTETSGLSALGEGEFWDFTRFNDFVFATGENNAPQYLTDIDTDTSWSAVPGSPPNAKRCAKVGEFLVLGNISGNPNRIQWSPYNNPAGTWGTDRLTQAGLADLDSNFGEVMRIVGGRYATVFQRYGIQRLTYVGPPLVWATDVIESARGCAAPFSIASIGHLNYFLADDGFWVTNGASTQPIGTNRINRWFFDNVAADNISRTTAAVDWKNEAIVWSFISGGAGYDTLLIYSWAHNRWSYATVETDWIVGAREIWGDLDSLDAIYGDLDSIPVSLDDDTFRPRLSVLGAYVDGVYKTFSGTPYEATWETGEAQPSPMRRGFVSGVTPIGEVDSWDYKVRLKMRNNFGKQTESMQIACGWDGSAPVRGEGQKISVELVKPAGEWDNTQGVQIWYSGGGYK